MFINILDVDCSGILPILQFIRRGVIPIIQIGIPIILIVLGMIDLGKAVTAGKEDEIKKAQQMLVKRAIYAVAIFFVVTIVTLIMGMFTNSGVSGTDGTIEGTGDWRTCWDLAK